MREALEVCERAIAQRMLLQVGVVNAAKLVKMRNDSLLRESVLSSGLIVADGMAVVWASRVLGRGLPERVTGIDLFEGLMERAELGGHRVFFLGATEDVLSTLLDRVREQHPKLRIAGAHSGYFSDDEAGEVAAEIRASGADLLFVGITSPKKEIFIAKYGDSVGVYVVHGVGGSFDIVAGKTQRAPEAWQRLGLEWAYRLVQEPQRMWKRYLVTNSLFLGLVAREWLRTRFGAATP
jgi:N-acetylglucosaminyldiphosphoundecaprenol N-acetyl-beta-D-mannosaminyltransferase